ncbi:hypothetical protein ABTZ58_10225 [Streptomyces sp. NPDC094143]|uniref:hypothetical protein n=1 Tax=Streptomyces sp. NPDC094143 TaxID=3155310 RepID=UPI00332041F7
MQPDSDAAALRRFANLMDEDDARTSRVGIPVSHGHYLLSQAVSGSSDEWDAEWIRLTKTDSRQAAIEWAQREESQLQRLIQLVYPGGATACPKSAAEVRSMADAIAEAASTGGAS